MEIPPPNEPRKREEGVGPLIGIIIIVSLILIAGVYFLIMEEIERRALPPTDEQAGA